MVTLFTQTLRSLSGKFGFNPVTGLPEFGVELGYIDRPEYTLGDIFKLLATADKFLMTAKFNCSYLFAVMTYGILAAQAVKHLQEIGANAGHNLSFGIVAK